MDTQSLLNIIAAKGGFARRLDFPLGASRALNTAVKHGYLVWADGLYSRGEVVCNIPSIAEQSAARLPEHVANYVAGGRGRCVLPLLEAGYLALVPTPKGVEAGLPKAAK